MGSVYRRGKNYYMDIRAEGKRVRKKIGPSKHLAELVLKETEVKVAKKKYDFITPDGKISDLFTSYSEYSRTNHRPTTHLRYWQVIRNFRLFMAIKHPGKDRISQLTSEIIENYKTFRRTIDPRTIELPSGVAFDIPSNCNKAKTKTLNLEIKTLRSVFNYGIKTNFCRDNPLKTIPLLKAVDSKQPRFLTEKECKLLLYHSPKILYL
jgi:site-specific recombinase XerD